MTRRISVILVALLMVFALCSCAAADKLSSASGVTSGQVTLYFCPGGSFSVTVECSPFGAAQVRDTLVTDAASFTCANGADLTITAVPDENCYLSAVHVSNDDGVQVGGNTIALTQISRDYRIRLEFAEIPDANFSIAEKHIVLLRGQSAKLHTENCDETVLPNIIWASADDSIATVSPNGIVLAKADGVTEITATLHEITAVCTVRVVTPITEGDILYLPEGLQILSENSLTDVSAEKIVVPSQCRYIGQNAISGESLQQIEINSMFIDFDAEAFNLLESDRVVFFVREGSLVIDWLKDRGYLVIEQ